MISSGIRARKHIALIIAGSLFAILIGFGISAQTQLFSDDFQDGNADGWARSSGTWSIVTDGSLAYRQSGTSADSNSRAGSPSWTNISVQARVKPTAFNGADQYVGVMTRVVNSNHYYFFALQNGNRLLLGKRAGSSPITLATKAFTFSTGTFQTLRLDANGSTLSGYVNGALQLTASDSEFTAGIIGGATFFASATFDDFLVTSIGGGGGTPPPAPTGLTAAPGNAQVTLNWNASSGASSYNVKRSTTNGGPYTTIATGVTSTNFTNTQLVNGTTYFFVVSAVNSAGESGNSNQASATPQNVQTPPPAPTGLTAAPGNAQVTLNWNASSGASSYNVKRSTTSGGPYTTIATGVTSTSFTNTGLTNGTTYFFVVSAVNSAGESGNSNQASATPQNVQTPPPAPTNLVASPGNALVALSWNASSGASSYNVKRSTTSGGPYTTIATGVTSTSFTNTGLTNGTTYFFVVSAVNSSGESGNSNQASATPIAPSSGDIFVAPNGTDSNPGTMSAPTTLTAAITRVQAGQTIQMRGGTYNFSATVTIARGNNGTSSQPKRIFAFGSERPILNFSAQAFNSGNRGLQLNGFFWHFRGLEVMNAGDNGIFIGGNNNTIERCVTHNNRDSGLQLGRHSSSAPQSEWPANNLILNCDSFDNFDPDNGEDADGFACKLTTGPGNVFRGCIAHHNVDDGWDLFTKSDTGAIGPVTIENCVSYSNGAVSNGGSTTDSDGNGFKLGGEDIAVNHTVRRSIAFGNKKHGFTFNRNLGSITFANNTSWDNGEENIKFDNGAHVFTNNLSFQGTNSDHTTGTDVQSTNCWWKNGVSVNAKGLVVSAADFVSLTPTVTRNADGTINLGNFLRLAPGSDLINAGTPSGTDIGAIESQ
jgi:fibronectin type 3 domain-containing protein